MTTEFLQNVLLKDLEAVRNELQAYQREENLWISLPGLSNSGGNLVLHLTGNLCHFIGAQLGGTGYVRNRDAEFGEVNVLRSTLEEHIDGTVAVVSEALSSLDETKLAEPYPLEIEGTQIQTGMFLARLVSHLAYHLGQINFHRRTIECTST